MLIEQRYPFTKIKLNYRMCDLEPFIDQETLNIHYNVIYENTLLKLNAEIEPYTKFHNWTIDEILFNYSLLPIEARDSITKYAGSVYNHGVYFDSLSPKSFIPNSNLTNAIIHKYQSIANFYTEYKKKAITLYGSGFVFLVCDEAGNLDIISKQNSQTTVSNNLFPIIAIDVWEHSFFLKYQNKKEIYIDNYIKIIDWEKASKKYDSCIKLALNKQL